MVAAPNKKELLLKSAKKLFAEYGYAETTFKKISERAGVALGLLTHHFGNKEKLFLTAGLDVLSDLICTVKERLKDTPNGLEAVRVYAQTYFEFANDPDKDFMLLIRCSPFSDLKTTNEKEIMFHNFAELYGILQRCLEQGLDDGSIRPVKDVPKMVTTIFCNLVGGVRHGLLTPYGSETLFDDVVDFIIYGLAEQKKELTSPPCENIDWQSQLPRGKPLL